jgi:hypothetical protein
LGWLKKPPALSFAALHHPLWDYGIVFALWWDRAVATGGGRSFYPNGWPIGGGVYSVVFTLLDPQRTRYGFGYSLPWSLARLLHALEGDTFFTVRLRGATGTGA